MAEQLLLYYSCILFQFPAPLQYNLFWLITCEQKRCMILPGWAHAQFSSHSLHSLQQPQKAHDPNMAATNGNTSISLASWVWTALVNLVISSSSMSGPLKCSHWAWPAHLPLLCSPIPQNSYLSKCCIIVVGDVCVCTCVCAWTFLLAGLYPPRELKDQIGFIFDFFMLLLGARTQ